MSGEALAERSRAWRPVEIEEPTNRWIIHPLSWGVARWCARRGIHPDVVSLIGLCCGIGAAVAYGSWHKGWTCGVGFLCMLLWHVFDGADGQVARLTGRASEWGKVMDGLCDHGTFVALYGALSWSLLPLMGAEAVLLAAAAGISHFVQATAYERQRQLYEFIVLGKPALTAAVAHIPWAVRWLYRLYLAVQRGLSGEKRLLALVAHQPASMEQLRQLYRQMFRPVVAGWSALSSNYRTLVLFAACCGGSPAAFFWWELLGLNAVLLALLLWTHRRQRRWTERIREESAQRL